MLSFICPTMLFSTVRLTGSVMAKTCCATFSMLSGSAPSSKNNNSHIFTLSHNTMCNKRIILAKKDNLTDMCKYSVMHMWLRRDILITFS